MKEDNKCYWTYIGQAKERRQGVRLERFFLPESSDTMSEQAKASEVAMDGDREWDDNLMPCLSVNSECTSTLLLRYNLSMDIKSKLANVPSSPGIYILKDSKEKVLYVGKAINLKK